MKCHYSPKAARMVKCEANVRPCPVGGNTFHCEADSLEDAQKQYEVEMAYLTYDGVDSYLASNDGGSTNYEADPNDYYDPPSEYVQYYDGTMSSLYPENGYLESEPEQLGGNLTRTKTFVTEDQNTRVLAKYTYRGQVTPENIDSIDVLGAWNNPYGDEFIRKYPSIAKQYENAHMTVSVQTSEFLGISEEQAEAVEEYTLESYGKMNNYMAYRESQSDEENIARLQEHYNIKQETIKDYVQKAKTLEALIHTAPDQPKVSWRGLNHGSLASVGGIKRMAALKQGDDLTFNTFVSTGAYHPDDTGWQHAPVRLVMYSNKGLNISGYSEREEELETVFAPGSRFKVVRTHGGKNLESFRRGESYEPLVIEMVHVDDEGSIQ